MKFPGLYVVFLILSIVATVIGLCLSIFSVYSPAWQVVELREFQAEHQVAVATFFFGLNCHARILFKEHFFFLFFLKHGLWQDCVRDMRHLTAASGIYDEAELHCMYKFDDSAQRAILEGMGDHDAAALERERHLFSGH